ncbi:MAG: tetratricopeptide repeat protein [Cyclobacteriaceae bacterium]
MKNIFFIAGLLTVTCLYSQVPSMSTADSLFKSQDWTGSVRAYTMLTKANPNPKTGLIFNRLGVSLYQLSRFNDAVPAFRRAIEISRNPAVMYSLACTFSRLNLKDSCYHWLDKAATNGFREYKQLAHDNDLKALAGDKRFQEIVTKVQINAMPCLALPDYRQLDFWIGEWNVIDTNTGKMAGNSKIELILDNCVIQENWQPVAGFAAKSFSLFDAATGKWKQTYVTGDGQLLEFTDGQSQDGALQFKLKSGNEWRRMTFSKLGDDKVKQVGERSADGKAWTVEYDLTYVKVK